MSESPLPVWNLMRTAHVVGMRFGALIATVDLTPTQFAVLMHLDRDEHLTQAELARRVLVRPQSIRALVESLIEMGLLARDGPGGRGRRARISLTRAGREALQRAWEPVQAFNSPAALGITAAQAAMLDEILDRIRTAMEVNDE